MEQSSAELHVSCIQLWQPITSLIWWAENCGKCYWSKMATRAVRCYINEHHNVIIQLTSEQSILPVWRIHICYRDGVCQSS